MSHIKSLDANGRVGGYLAVWGDSTQRDLQGDYFTPQTDFALDWFPRRPALYHHGLDGAIKAALVGQIDVLRADAVGLWAEAQLDLRHRYVQAVYRLVEQGVLAWSSGSLPHLVERQGDGAITRWPLIEGSLTPTPAEPRYTDVYTIKSAYKALHLDITRLRLPDPAHPLTDNLFNEGDITMTASTPQDGPPTAPLKRLPTHPADATKSTLPRIEVGSPFDQLSADDLLYGYVLMRNSRTFRGVSERYASALAHKVTSQRLTAQKADDLSYTTREGFGDEWVPDLWSDLIWRRARTDNVILPLFQGIEMPSAVFELPAEGADPTVYFVGETTAEEELTLGAGNTIPDSRIGSKKVTLTAKKLALRTGFSSELVEDAIVPVLNIYREQAMRAITNSIDHVLLNGDTAANNNINLDGGTPAANERYRAFDGLRKTALANDFDGAAAAPTLARMRAARFLMPVRYAARPSDLAWIVDGNTYAALLNITEFLTMDKAGALATAMTGQIGMADGAPVFVSAEMPEKTDDSGIVSATPADNQYGSALCVYRPGWYVGYRRRINVSVDYLPYYDSYQLTATVRLGFNRFDDKVASSLVNLDT